jgi:TonB family protein
MTFRRSLSISVLIHVLVFGSAIAFVQFGRGALWGHREVTIVSLVGSGSGTQDRASQSREHRDVLSGRSREPIRGTAPVAAKPEPAAEKQAMREEASLPRAQANDQAGSDTGGTGALQGRTEEGSEGSGIATRFGVVPPEQWAIIVSSLERVKTYPRMARERGIQGVVHVRFKLRPTGDVETVEIVKSSGYDILDTASIRTVYRAAPMPYVNGWVEVPIAYILK